MRRSTILMRLWKLQRQWKRDAIGIYGAGIAYGVKLAIREVETVFEEHKFENIQAASQRKKYNPGAVKRYARSIWRAKK